MNPRLQMEMTEARRRELLAEAAKFKQDNETRPPRATLRTFLASISSARVLPQARRR